MTIEEQIARLERKAERMGLSGSAPGTALQRVLVDVGLLDRAGVAIPEAARFYPGQPKLRRESIVVWSLSIGGLAQPGKAMCWGYTIPEALKTMNKALLGMAAARRAAA